ncbi:MAG: tetratricopeptide repeat protein [Alistipes sp.]
MNLIKTTAATLVFSLLMTGVSGQTPQIDSLEKVLSAHTRVDTTRVNLLNTLAEQLFKYDSHKAERCAQQSWKIASQLNYPKGKAASLWVSGLSKLQSDKQASLVSFRKALEIAKQIDDKEDECKYLISIGNVVKTMGDMQTSSETYAQALKVASELENVELICSCRMNISKNMIATGDHVEAAKELLTIIELTERNNNQELLARAYANLASIYRIQGSYSTALEYYIAALKINERTHNDEYIFINLVHIAGIQSDQNAFDAALETINRALKLSTKSGDSKKISICYTNLGNIYQRANRPEALGYFQKALSLSKGGNPNQNINILLNTGEIYTDKSEFAQAMSCFNEALALAQQVNNAGAMGEVCVKMGAMYSKQRQYSKAMESVYKARSLAVKTHYVELEKDCNKLLSDICAATGNFRDAYTFYVEYISLYDKLYNEQTTRKIALLESSYKFAKERQLYELEKSGRELKIKSQQQAIFSLILVVILVLLLLFVLFRSGRLKKKILSMEIESINKELEANQKAMAVAKLQLVQNAERDLHNVKMLENIGKNTLGDEHQHLCSLINDYKSQAHHSNWEEFETLFTKINASFWVKLNELNATLTPNERKLCAFLKLNMSNKDIALITFQSEEALKKSRLRLRKKLNLDRSINLVTFIHNL